MIQKYKHLLKKYKLLILQPGSFVSTIKEAAENPFNRVGVN